MNALPFGQLKSFRKDFNLEFSISSGKEFRVNDRSLHQGMSTTVIAHQRARWFAMTVVIGTLAEPIVR